MPASGLIGAERHALRKTDGLATAADGTTATRRRFVAFGYGPETNGPYIDLSLAFSDWARTSTCDPISSSLVSKSPR
jgi:hypothetical protein